MLCVHADFDPAWYAHFRQLGVEVLPFNFQRLRFNSFLKNNTRYVASFGRDVRAIQLLIETVRPDVVQVCGLLNIQAVLAAKRAGVPVVWQLLSTFSPPPLRLVYGQLVRRWAKAVMSTGALVARKHYLTGAVRQRLFPFYPPVETSRFTGTVNKKRDARQFFGLPTSALVIGTVGNRNRQKSHDQWVRIARQALACTDQDVYFVVVGAITPSYQAAYQTMVQNFVVENGLSERILFLESTIPVDTILSGFDIFLLSSMAEGVPTVLLEAMSVGTPVVSTDVGAIPEIIEDGQNGFLYPFGQNDRAASHLLRLIEDDTLRQQMARTNARDARAKFDTTICANAHKQAYDFALDQVAHPPVHQSIP